MSLERSELHMSILLLTRTWSGHKRPFATGRFWEALLTSCRCVHHASKLQPLSRYLLQASSTWFVDVSHPAEQHCVCTPCTGSLSASKAVAMQIGMDSIMLASGHCRMHSCPPQPQHYESTQMSVAQYLDGAVRGHGISILPYPQNILPVADVAPVLPPAIEQPYQVPGPKMWRTASMQSFAPQYAIPAAQMHAHVCPSPASTVTVDASTSAPHRL
jgi:hypothetical protein